MGYIFGKVIALTESFCSNFRVPYFVRVLLKIVVVILMSLIMTAFVIAGLYMIADNTLIGIILIVLGGVMFMSAAGALIDRFIRRNS